METVLEISNLTKQYDGFTLDQVSFKIPSGSIMGLVGENGAGKSTTIKGILDLIQKDDGSVKFWGKPLTEDPAKIKEDIGVVFDNIRFHEVLTPQKFGNISAAIYRQWDMPLYREYLKKFQLPPDREIGNLSSGMKMKLSIAVALSHHPKLLVLDEATSGLDPVMRDDILEIFLDFIQDEKHAILFSSHISTDLEKVADYITFIHKGKVIFSKSKDELIYQYGVIRCGAETYAQINKQEILASRKCDYQWEVLVADKEKAKRQYRAAVVDNASIDDILLLYIKGERKS